MKKIILSIDGMTCSACSNGLEKYLNKQKGINQASVNLVMSTANIEYDEKILNIEKINEFVKKAGFKSLGEFKKINNENKDKKYRRKFILFTILAIIFIYFSMGHMINLPSIKFIDININPIGYTIFLFIFAVLFIIYGYDIIKNGYKNLIHKSPNMDTLVSIGVLSSFLYSIYSTLLILQGNFSETHNLYFESVVMVIYFIKLGRYLDGLSKDKPMKLLTNIKIESKEDVIRIVRLYLSRWRIEEHFRGKKQEYDFENMRVRTLKSMNNLNMMLTIHLGHIAILADKIDSKLLTIKIIYA